MCSYVIMWGFTLRVAHSITHTQRSQWQTRFCVSLAHWRQWISALTPYVAKGRGVGYCHLPISAIGPNERDTKELPSHWSLRDIHWWSTAGSRSEIDGGCGRTTQCPPALVPQRLFPVNGFKKGAAGEHATALASSGHIAEFLGKQASFSSSHDSHGIFCLLPLKHWKQCVAIRWSFLSLSFTMRSFCSRELSRCH